MFKQQIGSRPRLIICGGGHVSVALVRMASLLAFDIWVIEDRPLFADNAKRQGADHVICGDYKKTLAKLEPQAELVADYGIMGDAHAGKWHRQVSLLSAEKIDAFRARGAQIDNGAFGENLIISGFDFKNLPLGTRFCIGDAILEMTQIGKQCHSHCAIYKRMGECIMPKEGVFAVVIRGGQIHTGDEVKLIPANIYASIKDRPADSRCELLTVIEGAHAGEKALYIDGRIRVA